MMNTGDIKGIAVYHKDESIQLKGRYKGKPYKQRYVKRGQTGEDIPYFGDVMNFALETGYVEASRLRQPAFTIKTTKAIAKGNNHLTSGYLDIESLYFGYGDFHNPIKFPPEIRVDLLLFAFNQGYTRFAVFYLPTMLPFKLQRLYDLIQGKLFPLDAIERLLGEPSHAAM